MYLLSKFYLFQLIAAFFIFNGGLKRFTDRKKVFANSRQPIRKLQWMILITMEFDVTRLCINHSTMWLFCEGPGAKLKEVECGEDGCTVSGDPLDPCLPIAIPDDDYDFAANRCLKFVRSMPVPLLNCQLGLYFLELMHNLIVQNALSSSRISNSISVKEFITIANLLTLALTFAP